LCDGLEAVGWPFKRQSVAQGFLGGLLSASPAYLDENGGQRLDKTEMRRNFATITEVANLGVDTGNLEYPLPGGESTGSVSGYQDGAGPLRPRSST
jgi:hypothetical protein